VYFRRAVKTAVGFVGWVAFYALKYRVIAGAPQTRRAYPHRVHLIGGSEFDLPGEICRAKMGADTEVEKKDAGRNGSVAS
jgi:hypothetical protein